MRAVVCVFALALGCAGANLREVGPLIDRLATDPEHRANYIKAMNEVLRPWLDEVIAPHGYSPGPATIASELNAELATALAPERFCEAPRKGACLGPVRITDAHEPYFMVVRTSVWVECGFEESAYLYEWSNAKWKRRLAIDEEPTVSGPPRLFEYFDVSPASGAGRRVVASAALLRDCGNRQAATAEFRVYTFDERAARQVAFDRRPVLPDHDPPIVRAEPSLAQFEFTVASISRDPETRRAVNTYAVNERGASRVQPVAHTVRSFVEEWITTPWEYALAWSGPAPNVMAGHDALSTGNITAEFMPTTTCPGGRIFEVGMEDVVVVSLPGMQRMPEVYLKVQSSGNDVFRVVGVSTEADDNCE